MLKSGAAALSSCMSEHVFQVNPNTGPRVTDRRDGWNGAHCGIFGQPQSGIASAFGLRYHLSKTIPKHGGHTCRIDVKPIPLRRKEAVS
jgi:hypothetical protein